MDLRPMQVTSWGDPYADAGGWHLQRDDKQRTLGGRTLPATSRECSPSHPNVCRNCLRSWRRRRRMRFGRVETIAVAGGRL